MKMKKIALIGGSGFVGRHLTQILRNRGYQCRILTRHAERHRSQAPAAELVEVESFNVTALENVLQNCDAAINLAGVLNPPGPENFRHVHIDLVEHIVSACHAARVPRLLHMSALGADQSRGSSLYLRTKGEGENRAHTLGQPGVAVTSFRPSVIFGEDDSFLNRFAQLLRIPGPLPLACPDSRFAPVYVGDVANAFANALEDYSSIGKHYDLCGPEHYTLEEIVRFVARHRDMSKTIIRLPDWASERQARMLQHLPGKPFTPDNYLSLQTPSICAGDGLAALDIQATPMKPLAARFLRHEDRNSTRNQRRIHSGR